MRFQTPLIPATLLKRYKRFLADIRLADGREVTAHCPNPGSMMGMSDAGLKVWVEPNDDPKKKLKYGLRLIEVGTAMVVVDTGIANKVVKEALCAGLVSSLTGDVRAEVPYGDNSRVDFLIENDRAKTWVEVKSVTLSRQTGLAEFPDSKTLRGTKHLGELVKRVQAGDRAVMLYLVSRDDCTHFAPAADIDPAYAAAEHAAIQAGVEIIVRQIQVSPQEVVLAPQAIARL
ncbi:DNA/RNA nuclease SfsA [Pacificibacter marinus]|uniref:Sugar fermentation stimulation protein homolog n=1 Tax=Pacificibacter marinus TaxID=658057 RepID=A0A1Y5S3J4_9RHOB|nr:DNA/RNA nuclease SfsA [Pacificibacter marinus]SEK91664.1 sugar fermentation stimulation protein A [Pacificibacter marinus]SLN31545.1 Sugar fermentation stimulation protein A [Pacificibacter marinus]